MNAVFLLEAIGLGACALGLFFALKTKASLSGDGRIVLCALFLTMALSHGLDFLEWTGSSDADQFGDIIKVLIPAVWLFFLFVVRRDGLLSHVDRQDRQLEYFFEASPVAVAILDREHRCIATTTAWAKLHGPTSPGKPMKLDASPAMATYLRAAEQSLRSGQRTSGTVHDGSENSLSFIEYKVQPFQVRGKVAGCILAVEDISRRVKEEEDREQAQRQLLQLQNLETLGEIAAGVAHDVNNMLQVIQAHTQALDEDGPESSAEDYRDSLSSIRAAVGTASGMTRWLLSHGRRKEPKFTQIDLGALLDRLVELLKRAMPRHQQLVLHAANDQVLVFGDSTLLEQLVINLVLNARDAMPEGGQITIELEQKDGKAILQVTDEGVGIAEDIRDRILEPFFTTKGKRGTGMGLTVVRRAVGAHAGSLQMQSKPGEGTCFTVTFPPVDAFMDESSESGMVKTGVQEQVS